MATLITKNSSTAAAVPGTGDLVQGELAVNVTDKKLYTKDSGGNIVKVVGSLGNQEANAVAITGGTISGGSISNTSISLNSALTTNGSTGTSGQVLTSQGSGSPAQWATLPGGFTLLATLNPTAGAATVSATGLSAFESFLIVIEGISLSSLNALEIKVSDNNGTTYSSGVAFTNVSLTPLGQVQVFRTKNTSVTKPYTTIPNNSSPLLGSFSTTGVINALRFNPASGGVTFNASGVIYIYGLG